MNFIWRIVVVKILLLLAIVGFVYAWMAQADDGKTADWQQVLLPLIANAETLSPSIVAGGLLHPEAIDEFARKGIKLVIDTRTPVEGTVEEKARVEAAGMNYLNIPIRSQISGDMIETLRQALREYAGQPIVMHCRSGRRVGMLWVAYQRALKHDGNGQCVSC